MNTPGQKSSDKWRPICARQLLPRDYGRSASTSHIPQDYGDRSGSVSSSNGGSVDFTNRLNGGIDISMNHGHGTAPMPGRESHTADLDEFDRYIAIMEKADRSTIMSHVEDLLPWEIIVDDELPNGEEKYDDDEDDGDDSAATNEPQISDIDTQKPTTTFDQIMLVNSNLHTLDDEESSCETQAPPPMKGEDEEESTKPTPTQQQTKYPFNGKIWTYIRSLLANAKPVGFEELQDPTVAVHKGPQDAHNFLSKVISIKPLNPIHPAVIAQMGDFDEHEVLAELFYGVVVGLVAMRFAPECIQCGSEVMDTDMLGRLPCTARCTGCNASNVIDSMDKIKVMFLLNSNVLYILAENFACTPSAESLSVTNVFAAIPANSTGSGYSYCIGTGADTEIAPALPPGKYRMHCPVALTDNYLVVKGDAVEGDSPVKLKLNISDLVYRHKKGKTKAELHVPHGKIIFDLFPDTNSFFVLWIQQDLGDKILMHLPSEERSAFTSATKVIHHPVFNALFHQVAVVSVRDSVFLSISHVVLVFTDIVDSTKMYTSLGDGAAFKLVRKHFQVLFESFTRNGGRVVKTIGDAVMASFISPSAALMAVSEAMALLPMIGRRPDTNNFVEIRVGIHSGQATVVPLNGVNDYFGQTTNIAARVQSCAKGSECFITETTLQSCGAEGMETYNELTRGGSVFKATPLVELTLKGVNDKVHARGFRWSMHSHRQSELRKSIGSYYRDRRSYSRLFSSLVSIAESGGSSTAEGDDEKVE